MKRAIWSLILCAAVATGGCSEDELSRRAPKLLITVDTDGYHYKDYDDDALLIDLGEVPVFATKLAVFKLSNPTGVALEVHTVIYTTINGQLWKDPKAVPEPAERRFLETEVLDFQVQPYGEARLQIPFAPLEELPGDEEHLVVADIESNATNGRVMKVTVIGKAIFTGAPDIEIEYNAYAGPNVATDCVDVDADGIIDGCLIPTGSALDFGNIGLGAEGTARLILRNSAQCTAFIGVDACSICALTVDADSTRQNIGLDFKPGTNADGYFSFAGSTATPFEIPQRNVDPGCNESGEVRMLLKFNAPITEGEYRTTIIVESNDPDEPLIEIPVVANARNAPLAIAKFNEFDPLNPGATDVTDPGDIEPLTVAYFTGLDSYDPATCPACNNPTSAACQADRTATPGCAIATWRWEVIESPSGLDPNDFALSGASSGRFSFWLPLAGHYAVRLTVLNTSGIQSGDTPQSRVEFDVIPGAALHVQATWDNASNDQDLHMTFVSQDDRVCNNPWDVHWLNKTPIWFSAFPAAPTTTANPNPSLDIDDTNGLGPENINIDVPEPGVYRVYLHYFGDFNFSGVSPTRETIRIFLNGLQVAEYRRTLTVEKAVWAVADITWQADGTGFVTPYPSDTAGEVGALNVMQDCTSPGWTFP